MAINTGTNVTKANTYAVLSVPKGVGVTKANTYAVLSVPKGVGVTKSNVYAVVFTGNYNGPIWSISQLPDGVIDTSYTATWDMPNSAPGVTYSVTSGVLPPGLSLVAGTGNKASLESLNGTPTQIGTFTFAVTAQNQYGSSTKIFTVNIDAPSTLASAPVITDSELNYGVLGVAYNNPLTIVGGTSPYTITLQSGEFPPGITLSGTTLSGKPTQIGQFNFVLSVTDANTSTTTQSFDLPVISPGGSNYVWFA